MFTNYDRRPPRMEARNRVIVLSLGLALGFGALASAQTVELKTLEPGVKKRQPQSCALCLRKSRIPTSHSGLIRTRENSSSRSKSAARFRSKSCR